MSKLIHIAVLAALAALPACNKSTTANASGNELTLMLKSDQHIAPGETDAVMVSVNRDGFEGPIDIKFSNLPAGVNVVDSVPIRTDEATRTYELRADLSAVAAEDHVVTVTATGGGLTVSERFNLTVDGG